MNKKTEKQIAKISATVYDAGASFFRCESCYDAYNAERNLNGRTHYVDSDTLKYFKARILRCGITDDNLLLWIVESVGNKPHGGNANKRFVAFDVWGNVVCDRDEWFTTTDKALQHGREWLAGFDQVKHTLDEIKSIAKRKESEAKRIKSILSGRKSA